MAASAFPLPTAQPSQWVVYLTARCNFACDYCIQKGRIVPGQKRKPWGKYDELTGEQWVTALNSFPVRPDHTLILTGGEPSIHRDFYFIASHLDGYKLDLTSNLTLDVERLVREMGATGRRFYSSFHTYHPEFMAPGEFVERALRLRDSGVIERPVFSTVNLDQFPHFRGAPDFDTNVARFIDIAAERGLAIQRNEFRGNHMGAPFAHDQKRAIECTSGWVNIAPNGDIYNCQYHLESRQHSFGNVTDIRACQTMPRFGTFFSCTDFGHCDSCHENSGRGAFRDADGVVFRRTAHDPRTYLAWMEPDALIAVGRRYLEQNNSDEAKHAFAVAKERLAARGENAAATTWTELGISLWAADDKASALDAMLAAVERGGTDAQTLAAAVELGRETAQTQRVSATLIPFVAPDRLAAIERAVAKTFV